MLTLIPTQKLLIGITNQDEKEETLVAVILKTDFFSTEIFFYKLPFNIL